jgi:hypothetical protein
MWKLLGCVVSLLTASAALGGPILNPANGHYYELITTAQGVSWDQASAAASALTFAGVQGHLATVTSDQEQSFISTTFNFSAVPGNGTYLGGFQPVGSPEPAGGWQWVTGEPFSVNHWAPREPNNLGGEDVIEYPRNNNDLWNDISRNTLRRAYLVEYDAPRIAPVPEPPAFLLALTGGLLGWGWLRRKRAGFRHQPLNDSCP